MQSGQNLKKYDPIAIIGIGCRFPGDVNDPSSFWKMLVAGTDAVRKIPDDRWNEKLYYDEDKEKPGKVISKWGGFIEGIDQFDPHFFGITPREAMVMDPQQRLLLQITWEALEDAGKIPSHLRGKNIGVFMGGFTLDYKILQFIGNGMDMLNSHSATGTMMTMLSNRISYAFDFKGPSFSIDTACSSSLTSIHLACKSLHNKDCSMAVAGGVLIQFAPQYTIAESKGGFLSSDGRCKTFDSRANGYVRGEGAGVVILKPLSKAIESGDPIYSVILGSAINHGGKSNGITVPNGEAQEEMINNACRCAGVNPSEIQYVEAHGTGTPVGDPIEMKAIANAIGSNRKNGDKCVVASVKTNIGHLEAAAGVASIIKTSLCIKNKQIPPHLHLKQFNHEIPIENFNIRVPTTLENWPKHTGRTLAAVNSFGFGGANANVILTAPPAKQHASHRDSDSKQLFGKFLLPISAKNPNSLKVLATSYFNFVKNSGLETKTELSDLCYSAGVHREQFPVRMSIAFNDVDDLKEKLQCAVNDENNNCVRVNKDRLNQSKKIAFVFSGMGPQWWGMGRQLMEKAPLFRSVIEKCDRELKKYVDWSLLEELSKDEQTTRMSRTEISQPANFAIQIALVEIWKSWGITPDAIVGHSTGEVAAFYAAGILNFEEAIKTIYYRSSLQQRLSGLGKMLAIGVDEENAHELIKEFEGKLNIAAINSPNTVTLAGQEEALEAVMERCERASIFNRELKVDIPYHSVYMELIKDDIISNLNDLTFDDPKVELYSTVTAKKFHPSKMKEHYWWQNVRKTVRFSGAITRMIQDGYHAFLEIGPHPVLSGSVSDILIKNKIDGIVHHSLRRKEDELDQMLESLGSLYTKGYKINWEQIYQGANFLRIPTYAWQNERLWYESMSSERLRLGKMDHQFLGLRQETPEPLWKSDFSPNHFAFLNDHKIMGNVVFPAAGYIEMALCAFQNAYGDNVYAFENIELRKALFIQEHENIRLMFSIDSKDASFKISSWVDQNDFSSSVYASGTIYPMQDTSAGCSIDLKGLKKKLGIQIDKKECYERLAQMGFNYGPSFQEIESLYLDKTEVLAGIQPGHLSNYETEPFYIHPATLDACFQSLLTVKLLKNEETDINESLHLPVKIGGIRVYRKPNLKKMYAHSQITHQDSKSTVGNIKLYDDKGNLLIELTDFVAHSIDSADSVIPLRTLDSWLYRLNWHEQKVPGNFKEVEKEIEKNRQKNWIIFADDSGMAEKLSEDFAKNSFLIKAGKELKYDFKKMEFSVNPLKKEDYIKIFRIISEFQSDDIGGVIHMYNLELVGEQGMEGEKLKEAKDFGCYSVIALSQALVETSLKTKLWILTSDSQPILESNWSKLNLNQSSVWGLGRVLGHQEIVNIWGGLIDIESSHYLRDIEQIRKTILSNAIDGEDQVAFRDHKKYLARLDPFDDLPTPVPIYFRQDATYVIAGAFGALGKLCAEWMAEQGARRLILIGRKPIPDRSKWHLLHFDDVEYDRIQFILDLEKKGVNVHVASLNITNKQDLEAYFNKFRSQYQSPIRGIINTVGIVKDSSLLHMDEDKFESVFLPKVAGTWHLHQTLLTDPLDFFVMYSSIASIVTTIGQTNYAAANAFLDAFAHYRRGSGLPAISINWGPWSIGMIKKLKLIDLYKEKGIECIRPEAGKQAMNRIMGQGIIQTAVLSADWSKIFESYLKKPKCILHLNREQDQEIGMKNDAQESIQDILSKTDQAEWKNVVVENLSILFCKIMRIKKDMLDLDLSLATIGIDSMMAVEIKNRIELSFNATINIVKLLGGYSVNQVADTLLEQIEESIKPQTFDDLVESTSDDDILKMIDMIKNK